MKIAAIVFFISFFALLISPFTPNVENAPIWMKNMLVLILAGSAATLLVYGLFKGLVWIFHTVSRRSA